MADKFQLYLPLLHILILLNTTIQKRTSPVSFSPFSSIQSHRCSRSLFLPTSTCHLYQSLSALRPTGRLLNALYPWLSGEVSSPHHLGITLLPNSHSSSLCLLLLLTTSYCSDFKSQRVIEDLIGAKAEVTVWCHRWAFSPFEKCQTVVCEGDY